MLLCGCSGPLARDQGDRVLRDRVEAAIDRELEPLPDDARLLPTTQPPREVEAELADRRPELASIGPQVPPARGKLDLGPDLTGAPQQEVAINLESTIRSAVTNNFTIQIARLQPAINEANVIAAEAAFDAVFFADFGFEWIDEPAIVPVLSGGPAFGNTATVQETFRYETGLRKRLTSGAEFTLSTGTDRFADNSPGTVTFLPDPAYTAAINLGIAQPLLRGFGTSVNTATIRLARNTERRSIQRLHGELLALLDGTEAASWDLVFSWDDLEIAEWLLRVGIEVRDVMARRRDFDTRPAEYSDAVARVEQRKAEVIVARRAIRAASDRLKAVINDPQLTVGSEALLVPVDVMVDEPIRYSLREAIMTGVTSRPEIREAALDIDDASIREMLASNDRLPLLDVVFGMSIEGQADSAGGGYSNLFQGQFFSYLLGINFETPIGNRAAQAAYRQARLLRSQSVINYQRAVQDVVLDVKSALRDCVASYELIAATQSNRIAQAENLRTLLVEEETLAGLTPEFLNLKFQRQERLALAERELVRSLVAYNKSVASLYRAMGVGLEMNRIELEVVEDDERGSEAADASSSSTQ